MEVFALFVHGLELAAHFKDLTTTRIFDAKKKVSIFFTCSRRPIEGPREI